MWWPRQPDATAEQGSPGPLPPQGAGPFVEPTSLLYLRDRFTPRARSLFFARLGIDAVALVIMAVPAFARAVGIQQPFAAYWLALLVISHLVAYFWVGRRGDHLVVFCSLCFDLLALIYLVTVTGGLSSPVMQGQIVYTIFFAIIFPSPLAILPPLLTLPVVTKIEQLLGTQMAIRDLMLLLWYFVVNVIIVYVVVYLDRREEESFRELDLMQRRRRRMALAEERQRIARDMHDGLGAILSSLVIQAEYLQAELRQAVEDPAKENGRTEALAQEMEDLHRTGLESMDELRRAVSMMRDDFDLVVTLEQQCAARSSRTGVSVTFQLQGVEQPLAPDQQLACLRVLQESISNAIRHGSPSRVEVTLSYEPDAAVLSVSDDGAGFQPGERRQGHYGLETMRERAQSTGGDLQVDSSPGSGTTVRLALPYRF